MMETKEYEKKLYKYGLSEEEIHKNYNSESLNRQFAKLGNTINNSIFATLLKEITDLFKEEFLKINLEVVINLLQSQREIIEYLHDNYLRKIWKSYLESIISQYFNSLLISLNTLGKGNVI